MKSNPKSFFKQVIRRKIWIKRPKKSISNELKEKLGIVLEKSFVDYFINFYSIFFGYPDGFENWKPAALKAAEELFKREKIEAIISVWPVSTHLIAKKLKDKYKIPWIADFPDLWTQNHYYPYPFFRKFFDKKLEAKNINSVDVLTTVTKP